MMTLLLACPFCFGAESSEQVRAAKIGVLVLLGVIVPLLGAIAFVARTWAKRARALDAATKSSA
jgi:branched-subunit amino acid permease